MTEPVTAAFLVIGNKILSGRTQDANLAYVAAQLDQLGIRLRQARVVPDVEAEIVAALDALRARYRYVFTSGGIGPTHDDITSASVAVAFGVPLVRHPDAVRALESHYKPGDLTEARLKMADVPEGASLIHNPVSKAPGFRIGNVFVMAGVPAILKAMFDGLKSELVGGPKLLQRTISCSLGEGLIAADLEAVQHRFPEIEIGSYPYFRQGVYGVSLVLRGVEAEQLAEAASAVSALIDHHGGTPTEDPV